MKNHTIFWLFSFFLALCLNGCCSKYEQTEQGATFSPATSFSQIPPHQLPYFYVQAATKQHNRPGTPEIVEEEGQPIARVNSGKATLYFEKSSFTTRENSYTNLVYRVHFQEVPFGLCELNLTTGNNPGLLIIYTLNKENDLILITTVHSCGCYLAFIPTSNMPLTAYPDNWPQKTQDVYGYTLPSMLKNVPFKPYYFTLESGSHRISDISQKVPVPEASHRPGLEYQMDLQPMENLYKLPYQGTLVSFFEESGGRKGYVKNNTKVLERLLISWWALDWHVGEDKAYGRSDTTPLPFYTSLKFWQRTSSDMKNFPGFLDYWGWKL